MREIDRFYIGGHWVAPSSARFHEVVNPATEQAAGRVAMGGPEDVEAAVAAARAAFEGWSRSTREERLALFGRIIEVYKQRMDDLALAICEEMGAPLETVAKPQQAPSGLGHFATAMGVLASYEFDKPMGSTRIVREPVGACGLITPWNWPANQIACKVAPALATGCTMVLKPSELAPFSAQVIAEILHEAGVPAGVFNLVHGDGPSVGAVMASHPDLEMMSFTGSTRAGILVAKAAADTVKKISLELGGKSPNLILPGAPIEKAVTHGVRSLMNNTGQSCNAPSRMLVPRKQLAEAEAIAVQVMNKLVVGDPLEASTMLGPQANGKQWERVQQLIERGIAEGARLVAGGAGRPEGISRGYFSRPTLFSDVTNDMTIAREEIFGPVLCMLPYDDVDEAVRIANDTPYGLSAYVYGAEVAEAQRIGARLRAGNVHLNGARLDTRAAFGGFKQSGIGREWGAFGFEEFVEIKSVFGAPDAG
ncbi:MAG: aldehyde dehydrogenase family protein [Steroidobacteraceae bacterium]